MTKDKIIPEREIFIGGAKDIGQRGFVFSFRIHSENNISYEQFLKGQRASFLPYHMILLWTNYFRNEFKINDKIMKNHGLTIQDIYNKWKLPVNDEQLFAWAKLVDPVLYKHLEKNHLKYTKK